MWFRLVVLCNIGGWFWKDGANIEHKQWVRAELEKSS